MRVLLMLLTLWALPYLVASQSLPQHRWIEKMDAWYQAGEYDKLLDRASAWQQRPAFNKPPGWVFSYYKSKAHYGLAQSSQGRQRRIHTQRSADLLRAVKRRDRRATWQQLDPQYLKDSHALIRQVADDILAEMDTQTAYPFYRALAEIYDDRPPAYRLLENRDLIREYPVSRRETSTHIMAWLFMEQVNELRASGCDCGGEWMPPVPPLAWDSLLATTARLHSMDMETQDYFDHTGLDGSKPWDRTERQGFSSRTVGENIAMGYGHEVAAFRGWKSSPGHCRNMMDERFTKTGLGRSGSYWTMVLAR